MNKDKPEIEPTKNGPYKASNLKNFDNYKGEPHSTKSVIFLCRCGGSSNKPFCDGTHNKIGFTDEKNPDRLPDMIDDYKGKALTIHDNRGVCSHRGYCTDNAPKVFLIETEPWIDPDGMHVDQVTKVIETCPSGALSYTREGRLQKDYDRKPGIAVTKDGPYDVVGGVEFKDKAGNKPESKEHFTLCRCGQSKNKPFCDGQHWHINFKDPKD